MPWLPFLPRYTPSGSYRVGAVDFERIQGTELSPDKHLCGRIFYPIPGSKHGSLLSLPALWIPHWNYAFGYTNCLMFTLKGWKFGILKLMMQFLIFVLGSTTTLPVTYNAPLGSKRHTVHHQHVSSDPGAEEDADDVSETTPLEGRNSGAADDPGEDVKKLPLIIFSHGFIGNRNTYSSICTEMASQGYLVICPEHADGSASASRLATRVTNAAEVKGVTRSGWRFYAGWGSMDIAHARTEWRRQELLAAHDLIQQLNKGVHVPGLKLSSRSFNLCGRVDMSRVVLMGHSWGGAAAALTAATHPIASAVVTLDPWWEAISPQSAPLNGCWASPAPLLVLGSHAWNTPNAAGKLACGAEQQVKILATAACTAEEQHRAYHSNTQNSDDDVSEEVHESSDIKCHVDLKQSKSHDDQQNSEKETETQHLKSGVSVDGSDLSSRSSTNSHKRGLGSLLLVFNGSSHHSYDDVLLFFGGMFGPILKLFNLQAKLPPRRAIQLHSAAALHFLRTHCSPGQLQSQALQPHHLDTYKHMFGKDIAILE